VTFVLVDSIVCDQRNRSKGYVVLLVLVAVILTSFELLSKSDVNWEFVRIGLCDDAG
jgi:hypothetical protein